MKALSILFLAIIFTSCKKDVFEPIMEQNFAYQIEGYKLVSEKVNAGRQISFWLILSNQTSQAFTNINLTGKLISNQKGLGKDQVTNLSFPAHGNNLYIGPKDTVEIPLILDQTLKDSEIDSMMYMRLDYIASSMDKQKVKYYRDSFVMMHMLWNELYNIIFIKYPNSSKHIVTAVYKSPKK